MTRRGGNKKTDKKDQPAQPAQQHAGGLTKAELAAELAREAQAVKDKAAQDARLDPSFVEKIPATDSLKDAITGMLRDPPETPLCPICFDNVMAPTVLSCCACILCRECLCAAVAAQKEGGGGGGGYGGAGEQKCPMCRANALSDSYKKALLVFPQMQQQEKEAKKNGNGDDDDDDDDDDAGGGDDSAARVRLLQDGEQVESSKIRKVLEIVEDELNADPTSKFVVFSHFLQNVVRRELESRGVACCEIGSGTSMERRGQLLEHFQDPASTTRVFLLNVRTCAAGLTLTAANHLIICEPSLDPKQDHQMIGRVRRLGQTRDITIHRLLTENTCEVALRAAVEDHTLSLATARKSEAAKKRVVAIIERLLYPCDEFPDVPQPATAPPEALLLSELTDATAVDEVIRLVEAAGLTWQEAIKLIDPTMTHKYRLQEIKREVARNEWHGNYGAFFRNLDNSIGGAAAGGAVGGAGNAFGEWDEVYQEFRGNMGLDLFNEEERQRQRRILLGEDAAAGAAAAAAAAAAGESGSDDENASSSATTDSYALSTDDAGARNYDEYGVHNDVDLDEQTERDDDGYCGCGNPYCTNGRRYRVYGKEEDEEEEQVAEPKYNSNHKYGHGAFRCRRCLQRFSSEYRQRWHACTPCRRARRHGKFRYGFRSRWNYSEERMEEEPESDEDENEDIECEEGEEAFGDHDSYASDDDSGDGDDDGDDGEPVPVEPPQEDKEEFHCKRCGKDFHNNTFMLHHVCAPEHSRSKRADKTWTDSYDLYGYYDRYYYDDYDSYEDDDDDQFW